ncbi:MAG: M3 family metallopeptidase [Coxiellaceae bacterium]|jgi:oligopeptidase A|nr:M3 family metallopeptidase [Coxiellaceae bacterium]
MKMPQNPLLQKNKLTEFDKILPKHFKPAIVEMLKTTRRMIKQLLGQKNPTWHNFIVPLTTAHEHLSWVWSTINHLNTVMGTKKVRTAYEQCLPLITKYSIEISQHPGIHQACKSITNSKEYKLLDKVQRKILQDKLRDFRLAGVGLPDKSKKRFMHLKQRLAKLSNKFAYNVLDASQNYIVKLNKKQIAGLPESALQLGEATARQKKQQGWVFTFDLPSYQALITFADCRSLRKKIYTAYVTRASDINPNRKKWDNTKIIEEILKIRSEIAKLISFKNYAEYSLTTKMAKNPQQVLNFLHDLAQRALPSAKSELVRLKISAKKYGIKKIRPWDLAYLEEKMSQEKFHFSQEDLRPYFPLNQVVKGVFNITKRLFGIIIKEKKGIPVWHQDVSFFEIYDQKHKLCGQFYLDPYCRENKRGGAWMDDYKTRYLKQDHSIQTPIAFLVCNFSPPIDKKPTLLTHDDVLTFLHEFGHCLQHLLTKVNYIDASGVKGIPWDAVEFASQFVENWGWQKKGFQLLSRHYKTHQSLPQKLLERLLATHIYNAALHMLRQLEFALIDFNLHLPSQGLKINEIKKVIAKVQKLVRVTPIYKYERTLHTFLHLFAGAYAAGYYSYKWAEVLSADAFSKFEEEGIFNRKTGKEFLHYILETGGSEEPLILFKKFRGRDPKIDALLRHHGIIN